MVLVVVDLVVVSASPYLSERWTEMVEIMKSVTAAVYRVPWNLNFGNLWSRDSVVCCCENFFEWDRYVVWYSGAF